MACWWEGTMSTGEFLKWKIMELMTDVINCIIINGNIYYCTIVGGEETNGIKTENYW